MKFQCPIVIHIRSRHRRCLITLVLVVIVSVQLVSLVAFDAHLVAHFLEGLIGHGFHSSLMLWVLLRSVVT